MDGFKRKKTAVKVLPVEALPVDDLKDNDTAVSEILAAAPEMSGDEHAVVPKPPNKRKRLWIILGAVLLVAVLCAATTIMWYTANLAPVDANDISKHDITIESGDSVTSVGAFLQTQGLIRSKLAFQINAYLNGEASGIKKGNCRISKSQSAQSILDTLVKGCNEYMSVMFYPGATIEKPLYKPEGSTVNGDLMYIKGVLSRAGYSDAAITEALAKQYTGPLFADKPAGTTLEGYIYGQTYHLPIGSSADKVLQAAFDEMYRGITDEGLVDKFKAQGLNLYQGITLASIVQRELDCEAKPTPERKDRCYQYQRSIAQVFLKRLHSGATLGSDVTFIYAADMKGVTPTVDIDSPYNTRINPGLPPGPIASPGLQALKAVGNPTDTDYYYFLAGDDGLIYFARTDAEHEANIKNHCQKLCNDL